MRSVGGEVAEAGPSIAVAMLGLSSVPQAGDEFTVFPSEADARSAGEQCASVGGRVGRGPEPPAPPAPRSHARALHPPPHPLTRTHTHTPRAAADAMEDARRLERLVEMAGGGSKVTLASLASIDEEGDQQTLQRINIILKVGWGGRAEPVVQQGVSDRARTPRCRPPPTTLRTALNPSHPPSTPPTLPQPPPPTHTHIHRPTPLALLRLSSRR